MANVAKDEISALIWNQGSEESDSIFLGAHNVRGFDVRVTSKRPSNFRNRALDGTSRHGRCVPVMSILWILRRNAARKGSVV